MRITKSLTGVLVGTLWMSMLCGSKTGWAVEAGQDTDRIKKLEAEVMRLREDQEKNRQRMDALLAELEKMKKAPPTAMPEKPPAIRTRFDVLTRYASEDSPNPLRQLTDEREGVFLARIRAHFDGQLGPGLDGGLQLTTGGSPNPT